VRIQQQVFAGSRCCRYDVDQHQVLAKSGYCSVLVRPSSKPVMIFLLQLANVAEAMYHSLDCTTISEARTYFFVMSNIGRRYVASNVQIAQLSTEFLSFCTRVTLLSHYSQTLDRAAAHQG
jgi:hypothetical protein